MYKCATCNRDSVRLYRPYGEFFREHRVKCKRHIPFKHRGWYVPLVIDDDGTVWGYTSAPTDRINQWKVLAGGLFLWWEAVLLFVLIMFCAALFVGV